MNHVYHIGCWVRYQGPSGMHPYVRTYYLYNITKRNVVWYTYIQQSRQPLGFHLDWHATLLLKTLLTPLRWLPLASTVWWPSKTHARPHHKWNGNDKQDWKEIGKQWWRTRHLVFHCVWRIPLMFPLHQTVRPCCNWSTGSSCLITTVVTLEP